LQTVGAVLVVALLITPGATAYLLTDRFTTMLGISIGVGVAGSFMGAYISYFLDGATGGVIVLVQVAIFLAAFVFAPKHGLRAARRHGLAATAAKAAT
jgi:manganese/iron transport system permease protein